MAELNIEKLEKLEKKYHELSDTLNKGGFDYLSKEYKDMSREHSILSKLVEKYNNFKKIMSQIEEAEELKNEDDPEMSSLAKEELTELYPKRDSLIEELRFDLLPKDPNSGRNVIVEIRAGTGGDEAALFAGDMFRMYSRYSEKKGWKTEILSGHDTGLGGYKEVIFLIKGDEVYDSLKFEGGTHRVQRIPETESQGRIHTSAITIAILPEAEETDVEINASDLKIDVFRASGPGGQSVNTTDSAVRITHLPTGLVVTCQDEKSQRQNKLKAQKVLYARLREKQMEEERQKITAERRSQVGTGDRSGRIRTYNYPQNRVTDHRINLTLYKLDKVMEGELDELVEKLIIYEREELINKSE